LPSMMPWGMPWGRPNPPPTSRLRPSSTCRYCLGSRGRRTEGSLGAEASALRARLELGSLHGRHLEARDFRTIIRSTQSRGKGTEADSEGSMKTCRRQQVTLPKQKAHRCGILMHVHILKPKSCLICLGLPCSPARPSR
jgi:hypothetical protein